jgi:hypothetical protein
MVSPQHWRITMAKQKYLFIFRHDASVTEVPSPAQMQEIFAAWKAWGEKFKDEIVSIGDGLNPVGKVVRPNAITDGPYVEAKEVIGGFSFIEASSIDRAVEISKSCPAMMMPGASIEIREQAGY